MSADDSAPLHIPRLDTGVFAQDEAPADGRHVRYRQVPLDPRAFDRRLSLLFDPESEASEALRGVADVVLAESLDGPILVTAPSAGAGRTTVTLNLALALAGRARVTVIDLDFWKPGVASAFGVEPGGGLSALLRARRRDPRAPIDLTLIYPGLAILGAGPARHGRVADRLVAMPELARVLAEVGSVCDVLLIDGPPVLGGVEQQTLRALIALDAGVVLVVPPTAEASGALQQARAALGGARVLGALVNRAPASPGG